MVIDQHGRTHSTPDRHAAAAMLNIESGRMRSVASTLVLAAAATALTMVMQAPGSPPSRPRIVAELSDLLTHSPLAACSPPAAASSCWVT
jgi:hypothetical protein